MSSALRSWDNMKWKRLLIHISEIYISLHKKKLKNDKILPIHRVTGVNLATRNKDKIK